VPHFPEKLYLLTEKDRGSYSLLVPFFRRLSLSSAATEVTVSLALTELGDRYLLLQSASARGAAGAAQAQVQRLIFLSTPSVGETEVQYDLRSERIATDGTTDWSGSILVPPNWRIRAYGAWNAGAAANEITISAIGVLIPRGSIQRL